MADAEATTWLDASTVTARLGEDVGGDVDDATLELYAAGVRAYLEEKRPDLWGDSEDGDAVFEATSDVVLGASLLTYRLYRSRTLDPTDAVAEDPHVRRLLGLGRRFVFGGAAALDVPVVVP